MSFQNKKQKTFNIFLTLLAAFLFFNLISQFIPISSSLLSPFVDRENHNLKNPKGEYEVFGFAPYWNIKKLDNIDFSVLTTFAYFDIPVNSDGSFDKSSPGYTTFHTPHVKELFEKAHLNNSQVVITFTQMDNDTILAFIKDYPSRERFIKNAVKLVADKELDGINIDFEYVGNPGQETRSRFTDFVAKLTKKMHESVPGSKVTVSVYASSVKDPKIYDIKALSQVTDGIFMMAYDFATKASDNAIPTSPLYGHKEGKYWYDVSTAVEDFLSVMSADKLILGLPWYGYNYPVDEPGIKAPTQQGYYTYYWYRYRKYSQYIAPPPTIAQTYAAALEEVNPDQVDSFKTGWDNLGKVGYKAYKENGGWRIIFLEDEKSLGIKYDFAKEKKLGGVGMWALGFDSGRDELWKLLNNKFGRKLARK